MSAQIPLAGAVESNTARGKSPDEDLFMSGLQKIANRITLGLILAALIVGAAMLMRIQTSFRLFGQLRIPEPSSGIL